MQNRYVGDIGDYGKYGLLRELERAGFKLGINWYLVPDEAHNDDGMHVSYLKNGQYYEYDPELHSKLFSLVSKNTRSLREIEKIGVFNDAIFYSEVLKLSAVSSNGRMIERTNWHNQALNTLQSCPIIFLDPDNGLEIKSNSPTSMKGNKYVAINELLDYYKQGHTVILYQHRGHENDYNCLKKFHEIKSEYMPDIGLFSLKYPKGTIRHYVFFAQPAHKFEIRKLCQNIAESKWKGLCEFIDVEALITE